MFQIHFWIQLDLKPIWAHLWKTTQLSMLFNRSDVCALWSHEEKLNRYLRDHQSDLHFVSCSFLWIWWVIEFSMSFLKLFSLVFGCAKRSFPLQISKNKMYEQKWKFVKRNNEKWHKCVAKSKQYFCSTAFVPFQMHHMNFDSWMLIAGFGRTWK